MLKRDCGQTWAYAYTTAHEDKSTVGYESDGYSKLSHKNMDLNNNKTGRDGLSFVEIFAKDTTLISRVNLRLTNKAYPGVYWLHN